MNRDWKAPPAKDMHSQVSITCHRISRTRGIMLDQDQCDRSLDPYLKKERANKGLLSLPGRHTQSELLCYGMGTAVNRHVGFCSNRNTDKV